MQSIDIQSFSYEERTAVLPLLTNSFADCGGWVLHRKTLSPTSIEFRLEIQLRSVLDLYVAILAAGIELTRAAHLSLTDLCTCRKHLRTVRPRPGHSPPHRNQLPRRRNPPLPPGHPNPTRLVSILR